MMSQLNCSAQSLSALRVRAGRPLALGFEGPRAYVHPSRWWCPTFYYARFGRELSTAESGLSSTSGCGPKQTDGESRLTGSFRCNPNI